MTPEEARQLKPGDRVLVEAEVTPSALCKKPHIHLAYNGNVAVKVATCGQHGTAYWSIAPEAIREKLLPPRRKYETGDVVFYDNRLWFVQRDESEDGIVEMCNGKTLKIKAYYSYLDLVCAYGERADVNRIRKNTEERREHDLGV